MKYVEYIGSLMAVGGALLLAMNVGMPLLAYWILALSCPLLIWAACKANLYGVGIMNAVFLALNIIGIIRWG